MNAEFSVGLGTETGEKKVLIHPYMPDPSKVVVIVRSWVYGEERTQNPTVTDTALILGKGEARAISSAIMGCAAEAR